MRLLHPNSTTLTTCSPGGRAARVMLALAMLLLVLTGLVGCDDKAVDATGETSPTVGAAMAGPVVNVKVSKEALESEPETPDLSTPEAAVRSYLDWTSYAYRTAQSRVAIPVMSSFQEVRVDSYVQYNIQQSRLLDQKLTSLTFGAPRDDADRVHVPVKETWSYTYVSIEDEGKIIGGPHEVSYDATYTVVPQGDDWVVDEVKATALGTVE